LRETNAMREVAVLGSGQGRLQLALRLLKNNYQVAVVSDRTAEQIFNRRVTSSQFMFHDSQKMECV
jgi:aspartate oxidase